MILVFLSWCWIGAAAFLTGFAVLEGIGRVTCRKGKDSPEFHILIGLCVLTVYSQIFSLFAGVGCAATVLLAGICLVIAVLLFARLRQYFTEWMKGIKWYKLFLSIFIVAGILYITAGRTWHYDTDLYHAQAIRWIEEYGVVKGLGNFHNRFAYNSAFFCLQALFSLKFAVNQSLHGLNGFLTALMLCYSVISLSIWKRERCKVSDFFKVGLFFYFSNLGTANCISSPGSDILTLCMVLYLMARWAELLEREEKEPAEYGLLCLLAVWVVTVKLSAGMLVFLAVYPSVLMVRQKKGKQIILFLFLGILIAVPFLIRNVLISGYLVYPYASLDLFSVDWKMAASVAADDSREIMAWGRGMTERAEYDAPAAVWLPKWYGALEGQFQILLMGNVVCLFAVLGYGLWLFCRNRIREYGWVILTAVAAALLLAWFFTAPLVRYGMVYMILLPAILMGGISKKISVRSPGWMVCAVGICLGVSNLYRVADCLTETYWKRPADYNWKEVVSYSWEGMDVFVPKEGDSVGYWYFPGMPGAARLESIELRTGELEGGFRLKEEYKNRQFNSSGETVD